MINFTVPNNLVVNTPQKYLVYQPTNDASDDDDEDEDEVLSGSINCK